MIFRLTLLGGLCLMGACMPVSKEAFARKQLYQLFKREAARDSILEERREGRLPEATLEAHQADSVFYAELLAELTLLDKSVLTEGDQINYDLFAFVLEDQLAQVAFRSFLIPMNAEGGFYTSFPNGHRGMRFEKEEDYERYLNRLKSFPAHVAQQMGLMRMGIEQGRVPPRIILEGQDQFLDAYIEPLPDQHACFIPFDQIPDDFAAKEEWRNRGRQIIADSVIPAYQQLKTFFLTEYFPAAREGIGIFEVPRGREYYQQRVKYFTTLDYTPDEIFEIGQQEVARIRAEMEEIIEGLGFEGSFADFLDFLRTDPRFYAKTPKELLAEASYISKKIDGRLPQLFSHLPRNPYGVEPVPAVIAPKYTGGRYVPGSYKDHRSGTYWVNTYKLESRPLYVLPALTLHEAVPGHHLQGALAQELEGVPAFRRHTYLSCYGEGWGLYAEYLGKEMGIYETPYEDFGRLTYEMWRACRLVVDVGIHDKGWTRDQAVSFMADNTALSLHEVNTEIDRYIGWPGQAISYKIGELKIRELRKKAEQALGDQFDLREFHRVVLSHGSVPLFVLEDLVEAYIEEGGSAEGP